RGAAAVAARNAVHHLGGQARVLGAELLAEVLEVPDLATRQRLGGGPRALHAAEERGQLLQRLLGEAAVGGDLAAEDRQQRRAAGVVVHLEHVVARDLRGIGRAVVVERAHAGIAGDDIG